MSVNRLEKLRVIYQLLFDLATGARAIDLEPTTVADECDQLLLSFFTQGKQLRSLALEQGVVPPYFDVAHRTSLLFVLDTSFRIIDLNGTVLERLHYPPTYLQALLFEELLDGSSKGDWMQLCAKMNGNVRFLETIPLRFVTFDGFLLPLFCVVTDTVLQSVIFVFSSDVHRRGSSFLEAPVSSITDDSRNEVLVAERVHSYILDHLEEPLPSLKTLAMLFGTEEHKLRASFRKYYHTSVYQFYQDERLKKAYLLILGTDLALKEVAFLCGFGMYLNFYKAFRKRYGFSPSVLRRE